MRDRTALACRSDLLVDKLDGDIVVSLAGKGSYTLKAGDPAENRADLITAIRGGQHAELELRATTFRQKDGMPNRRYLRHAPGSLSALAASYVGMPVLLDHDTHAQASRIGTITSSELHDHGGTGWQSFKMGLQIVKPEAVISVLDGTLDRFSIGWSATGPVNCSVHGVDVRSRDSCGCWPGETVMLDGKPQVVEFEFQSADGTEVSAVNVPAVKGTGIQEVRAALAAELSLAIPSKETRMFTRLAAALGLTALTAAEEDRAVTTIDELRRRALAAEQERDAGRTTLSTRDARITELETELAASRAIAINDAIDGAYRDGKLMFARDPETGDALRSPREQRLRKLAERDGVKALCDELAEMPQVVPVRRNEIERTKAPALTVFGDEDGDQVGDDGLTDVERETCRQLHIEPKDFLATQRRIAEGY
jgi:hypothetical protein